MIGMPGKRKRALLGSNPPRASRPETHGDTGGVGAARSIARLSESELAYHTKCL